MKTSTMKYSLLITLLPTLGCGPGIDSDLNLVNGKLDDQKLFPSVVQTAVTIGQSNGGRIEAKCSASIISSRVVLTAAHCLTVDDKDPTAAINGDLLSHMGGWGEYKKSSTYTGYHSAVYTNSAFTRQVATASTADVVHEGKRITGGRPILHPSYTGNTGPDVAVVVFPEGTFKDFQHMSVASGNQNYPSNGLSVIIVGFGKTDQFDPNSGGEKRYGVNRLVRVGSTLDFHGQTRSTTYDGTNVFNSQGDSGGPMISNEGSSKGQIIGVSSTQNTVRAGDTTGEGHYTNLLEASVETFLKPYLGEGQNIDLPNLPQSNGSSSDLLADGQNQFSQPNDNTPYSFPYNPSERYNQGSLADSGSRPFNPCVCQ